MADERTLEKTATPGVFRRGSSYVVVYRIRDGKQRTKCVPNMAEVRAERAKRVASVAERTHW